MQLLMFRKLEAELNMLAIPKRKIQCFSLKKKTQLAPHGVELLIERDILQRRNPGMIFSGENGRKR